MTSVYHNHTPRTNANCERFLGSVRRECLNHLFILQKKQLDRVLHAYVQYFNRKPWSWEPSNHVGEPANNGYKCSLIASLYTRSYASIISSSAKFASTWARQRARGISNKPSTSAAPWARSPSSTRKPVSP